MNVYVAKSAGFCFGVDRAVSLTEQALAERGSCWCLGELIHNRDVVERLTEKGLHTAGSVEDVPPGQRVIIRSHGVSRAERQALLDKNCQLIDATCPKVSRIHKIVERAGAERRQVVVFGEPDHPEVQGICGWCEGAAVVRDMDEFRLWARQNDIGPDAALTVVFQTTSNKENSEQSINLLKKQYTNGKLFDTICDATSIRQTEARQLAASCDAMVVAGGRHSANSIHLAEICAECCGRA